MQVETIQIEAWSGKRDAAVGSRTPRFATEGVGKLQMEAQASGRVLRFPGAASATLPARSARRADAVPEARPTSAATPVLQAMQRCFESLRRLAGALVAVHISAESGLPALALDDESLKRVLAHLVRNAAEAMPAGGTVRITARRALSRTHPCVLLHISDDGPGIPAYAMEHIFKPGFSSKRDLRSWDEPCGLGLTVVRDLVEGVGGGVEVASTRRRGTTFELRIPCAFGAARKLMI
jgi:signal transduction histidine kinase